MPSIPLFIIKIETVHTNFKYRKSCYFTEFKSKIISSLFSKITPCPRGKLIVYSQLTTGRGIFCFVHDTPGVNFGYSSFRFDNIWPIPPPRPFGTRRVWHNAIQYLFGDLIHINSYTLKRFHQIITQLPKSCNVILYNTQKTTELRLHRMSVLPLG